MKKIILLSFAILTGICSNAQKFKTAIITDVNFFRRNNLTVSPETFPFYFEQADFFERIKPKIDSLVKSKFKVSMVEFALENLDFSDGMIAPATKAKDLAKTQADKKTVYIAIETIVQIKSILNGVPNYSVTTRVESYNYRGKKVYKFKNQIPFVVTIGDEITGIAVISEPDLFSFYSNGLELAFEGKHKKVPARYIQKPPTKRYNQFLVQSEKFYMVRGLKGYAYGKELENLVDVITYKDNFWSSATGEIDFDNLFESNMVKDVYNLTNTFKGEQYLVKLKGGDNTIFNFLTISSDVRISFRKNKKETIGEFTYNMNDKLEGYFRDKKYKINWNFECNCAEVYSNDELLILINELHDRKVVYIHNSVNEEQLGDLFNLVFVYDFAIETRAKAEAMSANDIED